MIELKNINKTFKIAKRNAGLSEALKALFKKEYTCVHALRDVSFSIGNGEMVGYIGPNGAGKSSTVKIMSGILHPDSGECIIDGLIPWEDRREHVRHIGVVFGQRSQLWWDVPVIDSFELIRDIYRINSTSYRNNFEELVSTLELADIVRTPARQLSLGQRMRCEIAASLLHSPSILFLDEPTIGLDAVSKIAVREFIKRINHEHKTTVILTTHDMQDIEALTERILLIGKGQILLDGSLSELKKRNSSYRTITLEFNTGNFAEIPGITLNNIIDGHAVFHIDTGMISVSSAISELSRSADITDISVTGATAEEMVVSLYEEFKI
ncbi:MAG TPA: ATP-binding cassette domain-containing protein [Clostridia bacterium]|nr:ATP-binding cassette domain-containing protein [Clostridia bacterium]